MIRLRDVVKATKGELLKGEPDTPIESISIDSRTLNKGALFIAIRGKRLNGHNFVRSAINRGAIGILVSRPSRSMLRGSRIVIRVKDTVKSLGDIARYNRGQSKAIVVAITGSNGKTTTKDMVAAILTKAGFSVLSTKGTENNNIGVPLTLLRLKDEQFCFLEIGMNHTGEIGYLAGVAKPDVGVITNVGPSHLEYLGSEKDVLRTKLELLKYMDEKNTLVLNGDDPHLSEVSDIAPRIVRFGLKDNNEFRATSIECDGAVQRFYVNNAYEVQLNLLGRHNIYNALASIAVAGLFGIKAEAIRDSLKDFKSPHSRLELKDLDGIKIIDDTYNSNPSSLRCALEALHDYPNHGRKILVSGDMLELGNMSRYFHRAVADMAETSGVDMLITVGRHSRKTYLSAKDKGMKKGLLFHFDKPEKAGRLLKRIAKKGDLILIKGSRAVKMEEALRCFTMSSTR